MGEIFVFDMCSFIHFIIHLLIKIFTVNIYKVTGAMPSQRERILWEVTYLEPIRHCFVFL